MINQNTTLLIWFILLIPIIVFISFLFADSIKNKKTYCFQPLAPPKVDNSVSASNLLQALNTDSIENFLGIGDEPSVQDLQNDHDLLTSLIRNNINTQKEAGVENPTIDIPQLKESINTSFKNSDRILDLLQATVDEMNQETMTPEVNFIPHELHLENNTNKTICTTPSPQLFCQELVQERQLKINTLEMGIEKQKVDTELLKKNINDLMNQKVSLENQLKNSISKKESNQKISELQAVNNQLENLNKELEKNIGRIQEEKLQNSENHNRLLDEKNTKIQSLQEEVNVSVPKIELVRFQDLVTQETDYVNSSLKSMLGLNKLIVLPSYTKEEFKYDEVFPISLGKNEGIISFDKKRFFVYQKDDNIVSYDLTKNLKNNEDGTFSGTAVWASNTYKGNNGYRWSLDRVKIGYKLIISGFRKKNNARKNFRIEEELNITMTEVKNSLFIVIYKGNVRIL
jgi:hypothetical protein